MKQKIIELLKDSAISDVAKYNAAMALYRTSEYHSVPAASYYNRAGFTQTNLKNLLYDLKKLHGITDADINAKPTPEAKKKPSTLPKENDHARIDVIKDIPEKEATGLKLREQFPFLEADDCPDKLKILVSDRITAWKKYKDAHAELLKHAEGEALTDTELLELASTAVEKYELNELIWAELNHYKEHGEILGKHEIFNDEVLEQKVDLMDVKELMTRQKTLRSYVSRDGKKLAKAKNAESKARIQAKVDEWNKELGLVDAKLQKQ